VMAELKKVGDLVRLRRDLKTTGAYTDDVMLVLGLKNSNWSFHDYAEVWNPRKNVRLSFYCMDLEVLQRRK